MLEVFEELSPVDLLLIGDGLEHLEDAGHHSLQSAEVDVGAIAQLLEHLVTVLLHLSHRSLTIVKIDLASGLFMYIFSSIMLAKLANISA